MKRRRWRRSTKAKPDEIWTNSILHMAGLLVHAVSRVWKKNLGSLYVSTVTRLRMRCLVDGCCCADVNVKEGNGVLAPGTAPDHEHRHWSGQLHLGTLTLTVLWVARMVRRCAGTCSSGLRIGFPRFRGLLEIIFQSVSRVNSMGAF